MADPPADLFADLTPRFRRRARDYLRRLTTSEEEFLHDPELNGVAIRRGYLRGRGPRPTATLADRDAAGAAAQDHLVVWADEPRLRASPGDPWDVLDVHTLIARLHLHPYVANADGASRAALAATNPFDEPPPLDSTETSVRGALRLLRQAGATSTYDLRMRVRTLFEAAIDPGPDPRAAPRSVFDRGLTERVVAVLDAVAEPEPGRPRIDELADALAGFDVTTDGSDAPPGSTRRRMRSTLPTGRTSCSLHREPGSVIRPLRARSSTRSSGRPSTHRTRCNGSSMSQRRSSIRAGSLTPTR